MSNLRSVLEEVNREVEKEKNAFENIINSDNEFNIIVAIMPDDYIIRLYDYLIKTERNESFMADRLERKRRIVNLRNRISTLERLSVIQEHLNGVNREEVVIESTATVIEDPKVKKRGPFKNFTFIRASKKKN